MLTHDYLREKYNEKKTKKTLEELEEYSTILHLLLTTHLVYTKQELMSVTGMNERAVRQELENIAKYYPVRASAGRKGYSIIWFDDNSTLDELKEANQAASEQLMELEHRISSLKMRMRPLIALCSVTCAKISKYEGEK